jgi:hypothetical protein
MESNVSAQSAHASRHVSAPPTVLCQGVTVAFDVFFQGFIAGGDSGAGGAQMRAVLAPYVAEERGSFLRVRVGDGEADIYFDHDDGMMANRISGRDPWDLLFRGAQAANWVILPLNCPTCLTGPGQREELPEGLDEDVIFVETGADLLAVIESA